MPFKRIFFGLLILSVLTSEGTALFNKVTAPLRGCFIDICETGEPSVRHEDERLINPVKNHFAPMISFEQILQVHNSHDGFFSLTNNGIDIYRNSRYYCYDLLNKSGSGNKIIIHASDVSPPIL